MSKILISIVIPTYNSAHYIERLLLSLLSQTYKIWEAIIVDNNSNDDTIKFINKHSDPRIKTFFINNNGVIAKSRNLGIEKSNGEWIAFLDSDDWWDLTKLEYVSKYLNKEFDIIYHKLAIASGENDISNKTLYYRKITKNAFKDMLIHGNFMPNSSILVRKSLLENVGYISEKLNLIGSEDYNLLLKILKVTKRVKFVPKILGFYYFNINGVSRKQMSISHQEAISEFLSECTEKEIKYIKGHIAYMDSKYLILNAEYINSKQYLIEAFKHGTFRIKIKSVILLFRLLLNDKILLKFGIK